jgi:6-pyruvoyltetrahydropterin/6-carboxytetrahydropterin synthase
LTYETGLSRSFVAWHVFPGMEGPEGQLHSHEYRLEIVVKREQLDNRGMVCDLDFLEAMMEKVVAVIEDKDLELIRPPDADAVTVELLARWAHSELSRLIADEELDALTVRVWESPVAFGGYSGAPRTSSE